jgi:cytochrome c-type biogenesis protein CcmE
MTRKQRRLSLIGAALGVIALAVALVLGALKESIVFFNSPTDVVENDSRRTAQREVAQDRISDAERGRHGRSHPALPALNQDS